MVIIARWVPGGFFHVYRPGALRASCHLRLATAGVAS